jgi:hypothetical protein
MCGSSLSVHLQLQKRRIAELMSQLPMELDVEKLVQAALGVGMIANADKAKNQQATGGAVAAGGDNAAGPAFITGCTLLCCCNDHGSMASSHRPR